MVEEGAAEGSHEEFVGERILLRPFPQPQLAAVEIAHRPTPDIRHGSKHVVLAAIDLFLVVIERVNWIGCELVERHIDGRRIDAEWLIRHSRKAAIRFAMRAKDSEIRQHGPVMIELRLLLGRWVGYAVGTWNEAGEAIRAPALRI